VPGGFCPDSGRPSICKFLPITRNRERFCSALFLDPCIELETALDEHTAALLQILLSDFGQPRPKCHINKKHFFAALPLSKRDSINGESKLCNWSALCREADLGIPRNVSDQQDTIKTCQGQRLGCRWRRGTCRAALHLFADPGHLLDFAGFLAQGILSPHPGFSHDLLRAWS
jgi:hypothetical protein